MYSFDANTKKMPNEKKITTICINYYHKSNAPPCDDSADVECCKEGIYKVVKVCKPVIQCADMLFGTLQRTLKVFRRSTKRAVSRVGSTK